jgi:hypothetical protein
MMSDVSIAGLVDVSEADLHSVNGGAASAWAKDVGVYVEKVGEYAGFCAFWAAAGAILAL